MSLTRTEAGQIKARLVEVFKDQQIAFGLSARRPSEFVIAIRPHTSVSDETLKQVTTEAIRFAKDELGKVIDEHALDVARIGRIQAQGNAP